MKSTSLVILLLLISLSLLLSLVDGQIGYEGLDVIPSTNLDSNKRSTKNKNNNDDDNKKKGDSETKTLSNKLNKIFKSVDDRIQSEDKIFKLNNAYYENIINRINNMASDSSNRIQSLKNKTLDKINNEQNTVTTQIDHAQQKLSSIFGSLKSAEKRLDSSKQQHILFTSKSSGSQISASSIGDVIGRFSVTKNLQEQIISQANSQVPNEQIASFVQALRPELTQAQINDIILAVAIQNNAVIPKSQSMAKSFADQQLKQKIDFKRKKEEMELKQKEMMSKSRTSR